MRAIDVLTSRVSSPRLKAPAPDQEELEILFRSAARAADHGLLKPYRFLVVSGEEGLQALGRLFREASLVEDPALPEKQLARIELLPLRAPMVLVAIASCQTHPKVPEIEQQLTAAAAVQNLINAAYALDIGAMWRTGTLAYNTTLKQKLGLTSNETIIGFIYLGKASSPNRVLQPKDRAVDYIHWPGEEK